MNYHTSYYLFKHISLSNIGLNTSFTIYMMFSPVSYKRRSDRVQECMTDNKCISIYNVDKNKW
jgi:hypothetical protein